MVLKTYKAVLMGGRFPAGFFKGEEGKNNAKICVKFMIEDILKLNRKNANKLRLYDIMDNDLYEVYELYNNSIYAMVNDIYPNAFKIWEFKQRVPKGYWQNKDNAREATRWMIEDVNGWDKKQVLKNLTRETFLKNGLYSVLYVAYGGSSYDALNSVYPNMVMPWEMKRSPRNTWDDPYNAKAAVKWLMDKMGWNEYDFKRNINRKIIAKYGLGGMLLKVYDNDMELLKESVSIES